MTTDVEIAWAAGLFEGEGCWRWRLRSGDKPGIYAVQTVLSMTDRDVVERFMAIVGFGTIYRSVPANPRAKVQWKWESGRREDIKRMAEMFLPYLGSRRAERAREILAVPDPIPYALRAKPQATHCRHGHLYDEANTYVYVLPDGRANRRCKACQEAANERLAARRREAVTA